MGMVYAEFKSRYNILAAQLVAKAKNDKAAAAAVLNVVGLEAEKFRLGHTKVFLRAGILGKMEETREDRIGSVLAWLQSGARGKASRMQFKKLQDQKLALYACQRAIRNFMTAKTWYWMQIWLAIKPHLKCTQFGKFKKEYEDKIALAEANIDGALEERAKVQAVYDDLLDRRMSFHLPSSRVDLLSKKSLTKPHVLKDRQLRYRLSCQEFKTESRAKNNRNLLLRGRLQKLTLLLLRWKVR